MPKSVETGGEFYGVWDRLKPTIRQGRERWSNKLFLQHLEKAAERYEKWAESRMPGHIAAMQQMQQQMRAQSKKAA